MGKGLKWTGFRRQYLHIAIVLVFLLMRTPGWLPEQLAENQLLISWQPSFSLRNTLTWLHDAEKMIAIFGPVLSVLPQVLDSQLKQYQSWGRDSSRSANQKRTMGCKEKIQPIVKREDYGERIVQM
ncbi:hypothetical protein WISP_108600 [Willisornis vidua]|uniref:Uncharacterized protein n=1 Tax=Willisornis vidua TaxID=1566151 RepID=A0ABQ9D1M6_9PASS|nr:hypothetical protein WISP_108600 [Willisornis vidua]